MLLSQAQKRPPVFFQRKSFNVIIPGTEGTAGSVTGWDVASADTR